MSQRPVVHVPRYILEATSLLWVQKQLKHFYIWDCNHDGIITPDEALKQRFTLGPVDISGEMLEATGQAITSFYDHILAGCVTLDSEGNKQVLWRDFIIRQYQRIYIEYGLDKERRIYTPLNKLYFDAMDSNSDGVVQRDEFDLVYRQTGISRYDSLIAFSAIDTNSDGVIGPDEFLNAWISFWLDMHFTSGALAAGVLPIDQIVPTED